MKILCNYITSHIRESSGLFYTSLERIGTNPFLWMYLYHIENVASKKVLSSSNLQSCPKQVHHNHLQYYADICAYMHTYAYIHTYSHAFIHTLKTHTEA